MSGRSAFALSVRKDLRAMAPALLASVAVMVAALLVGGRFDFMNYSALRLAGVTAYVIGAAALGALVVGHEYTHRTLGWLLAQPVSRRTLLLGKAVALALGLMVMALAGLAFLQTATMVEVVLRPAWGGMPLASARRAIPTPWTLLVLPLLCGAFLAPWLTMVCRSALAGIVFSIFLPAMAWLGVNAATTLVYGRSGFVAPELMKASIQMVWVWCLALCAAGAVFGWRRFVRLDAIDQPVGTFAPITLWKAPTVDAGPTRVRHPAVALVHKELRVQTAAFVVAVLYAIGYVAVQVVVPVGNDVAANLSTLLFVIYVGVMTVLVGASTVAEERRLGITDWQLLLPTSARHQWTVKVAVAAVVAVVLIGVMPWLLTLIVPPVESSGRMDYSWAVMILALGLSCAIFVSSWAPDGLRALLGAGAMLAIGAAIVATLLPVAEATSRAIQPLFDMLVTSAAPDGVERATHLRYSKVSEYLFFAWTMPFIWLLLRYGYRNFKSSRPARPMVARQFRWLVTLQIALVLAFSAFSSLSAAVYTNSKVWREVAERQRLLAEPRPADAGTSRPVGAPER